MTPEPYASIIHAAQLNILTSVINMIATCTLIYGTLKLRKGTRANLELSRLLAVRASGMEAREGRDAAERLDGEAATARPDAQEQPLEQKY